MRLVQITPAPSPTISAPVTPRIEPITIEPITPDTASVDAITPSQIENIAAARNIILEAAQRNKLPELGNVLRQNPELEGPLRIALNAYNNPTVQEAASQFIKDAARFSALSPEEVADVLATSPITITMTDPTYPHPTPLTSIIPALRASDSDTQNIEQAFQTAKEGLTTLVETIAPAAATTTFEREINTFGTTVEEKIFAEKTSEIVSAFGKLVGAWAALQERQYPAISMSPTETNLTAALTIISPANAARITWLAERQQSNPTKGAISIAAEKTWATLWGIRALIGRDIKQQQTLQQQTLQQQTQQVPTQPSNSIFRLLTESTLSEYLNLTGKSRTAGEAHLAETVTQGAIRVAAEIGEMLNARRREKNRPSIHHATLPLTGIVQLPQDRTNQQGQEGQANQPVKIRPEMRQELSRSYDLALTLAIALFNKILELQLQEMIETLSKREQAQGAAALFYAGEIPHTISPTPTTTTIRKVPAQVRNPQTGQSETIVLDNIITSSMPPSFYNVTQRGASPTLRQIVQEPATTSPQVPATVHNIPSAIGGKPADVGAINGIKGRTPKEPIPYTIPIDYRDRNGERKLKRALGSYMTPKVIVPFMQTHLENETLHIRAGVARLQIPALITEEQILDLITNATIMQLPGDIKQSQVKTHEILRLLKEYYNPQIAQGIAIRGLQFKKQPYRESDGGQTQYKSSRSIVITLELTGAFDEMVTEATNIAETDRQRETEKQTAREEKPAEQTTSRTLPVGGPLGILETIEQTLPNATRTQTSSRLKGKVHTITLEIGEQFAGAKEIIDQIEKNIEEELQMAIQFASADDVVEISAQPGNQFEAIHQAMQHIHKRLIQLGVKPPAHENDPDYGVLYQENTEDFFERAVQEHLQNNPQIMLLANQIASLTRKGQVTHQTFQQVIRAIRGLPAYIKDGYMITRRYVVASDGRILEVTQVAPITTPIALSYKRTQQDQTTTQYDDNAAQIMGTIEDYYQDANQRGTNSAVITTVHEVTIEADDDRNIRITRVPDSQEKAFLSGDQPTAMYNLGLPAGIYIFSHVFETPAQTVAVAFELTPIEIAEDGDDSGAASPVASPPDDTEVAGAENKPAAVFTTLSDDFDDFADFADLAANIADSGEQAKQVEQDKPDAEATQPRDAEPPIAAHETDDDPRKYPIRIYAFSDGGTSMHAASRDTGVGVTIYYVNEITGERKAVAISHYLGDDRRLTNNIAELYGVTIILTIARKLIRQAIIGKSIERPEQALIRIFSDSQGALKWVTNNQQATSNVIPDFTRNAAQLFTFPEGKATIQAIYQGETGKSLMAQTIASVHKKSTNIRESKSTEITPIDSKIAEQEIRQLEQEMKASIEAKRKLGHVWEFNPGGETLRDIQPFAETDLLVVPTPTDPNAGERGQGRIPPINELNLQAAYNSLLGKTETPLTPAPTPPAPAPTPPAPAPTPPTPAPPETPVSPPATPRDTIGDIKTNIEGDRNSARENYEKLKDFLRQTNIPTIPTKIEELGVPTKTEELEAAEAGKTTYFKDILSFLAGRTVRVHDGTTDQNKPRLKEALAAERRVVITGPRFLTTEEANKVIQLGRIVAQKQWEAIKSGRQNPPVVIIGEAPGSDMAFLYGWSEFISREINKHTTLPTLPPLLIIAGPHRFFSETYETRIAPTNDPEVKSRIKEIDSQWIAGTEEVHDNLYAQLNIRGLAFTARILQRYQEKGMASPIILIQTPAPQRGKYTQRDALMVAMGTNVVVTIPAIDARSTRRRDIHEARSYIKERAKQNEVSELSGTATTALMGIQANKRIHFGDEILSTTPARPTQPAPTPQPEEPAAQAPPTDTPSRKQTIQAKKTEIVQQTDARNIGYIPTNNPDAEFNMPIAFPADRDIKGVIKNIGPNNDELDENDVVIVRIDIASNAPDIQSGNKTLPASQYSSHTLGTAIFEESDGRTLTKRLETVYQLSKENDAHQAPDQLTRAMGINAAIERSRTIGNIQRFVVRIGDREETFNTDEFVDQPDAFYNFLYFITLLQPHNTPKLATLTDWFRNARKRNTTFAFADPFAQPGHATQAKALAILLALALNPENHPRFKDLARTISNHPTLYSMLQTTESGESILKQAFRTYMQMVYGTTS